MKAITLSILFGAVSMATAQTNFTAQLTIADDPSITGVAAFALEGSSVDFTISITLEDVVPTTAQLVGTDPQSEFSFDLGAPHVAIHSPGPWPNGYDGSTAFFGTFTLPESLREDFVGERTTLELLDTRLGDFSGPVLSTPPPQIAAFNRAGSTVQIQFTATPPFQYTLESLASLAKPNSLTSISIVNFTNVAALSQTFESVVFDSVTNSARFYRIRRELCCE